MSKASNSKANTTGGGSFPNYNSPYDFVIQWIEESTKSKKVLKSTIERTMDAYEGKPSKNTYKANAASYGNTLNNPEEKSNWQRFCSRIPDGHSDILRKSIETVVSQLQGGIGQYDYEIDDPTMNVDDDLIQRLQSATSKFYIDSGIEEMKASIARDMLINGAAYVYVTYDKDKKDFKATLLEAWRVINDPNTGRINRRRYCGFHQMESWIDVKKDLKFREDKLVTLNDMDIYVKNVNDVVRNPNFTSEYVTENNIKETAMNIYGVNYYKGRNLDQDLTADNKYRGDDVEICYVWDLNENKRYKVLNRKFVIEAVDNDLHRDVKYVSTDPRDPEGKKEIKKTKKININCPIIEIPYLRHPRYSYPVTPVWGQLDTFDEICSAESLRSHNMSIMGPINFFGSPYDIEILTNAANIAGVGIEGMDGTAGVLNKQHDVTIVDQYIRNREEEIKKALNSVDEYDMQAMMGDRASAREAGNISLAIAQGLNPLVAVMESGIAKVLRVFELLYVIYNEKGKYAIINNGKYDEVTVQEMALDAIINVKLQSQIENRLQMISATAMSTLNFLLSSGKVNEQEVLADFIPLITQNVISRKRARAYYQQAPATPQEIGGAIAAGQGIADMMNAEQQNAIDNYPQAVANAETAGMGAEDLEAVAQELGQPMPQGNPYDAGYGMPEEILGSAAQGLPSDVAGEIANTMQ